jgi:hypothetical protein
VTEGQEEGREEEEEEEKCEKDSGGPKCIQA